MVVAVSEELPSYQKAQSDSHGIMENLLKLYEIRVELNNLKKRDALAIGAEKILHDVLSKISLRLGTMKKPTLSSFSTQPNILVKKRQKQYGFRTIIISSSLCRPLRSHGVSFKGLCC